MGRSKVPYHFFGRTKELRGQVVCSFRMPAYSVPHPGAHLILYLAVRYYATQSNARFASPSNNVQHYPHSLYGGQMAEQQILSQTVHKVRRKVGQDGNRITTSNHRIAYENLRIEDAHVRISENTKSIDVLEKLCLQVPLRV
jgi:hypothetical protein